MNDIPFEFKDRLKEALDARSMKPIELSEKSEIRKSSISQYMSGYTKPKTDKLYALALALKVSPVWLMGYDVPMESEIPDMIISSSDNIDSVENSFLIEAKKNQQNTEITEELIPYDKYDNLKPVSKQKIPLIGEIACGEPILAQEEFETYYEADDNINADCCLRCKGDSMIDFGINNKDIVFIHKQPTVENGEIAAVIVDDSATLKRVYFDKETATLRLRAGNPAMRDLEYSNEELEQVRILGKAVKVLKDLK